MRKHIRKVVHHLRRQPDKTKRDILHLATIFCAVVLVLIWSLTLGKSLKSPETKAKIKDDLKPFSVLKDNLINGYNSMGEPLPVVTE